MKKLLSEFKEFALKGNMLDLAVGVLIGPTQPVQASFPSRSGDWICRLVSLFPTF